MLKINFANTFNLWTVMQCFQKLATLAPNLYAVLWKDYDNHPLLFYEQWTIPSVTECQQGDPTGLMLFCLAIQIILECLVSQLVCFYLDDGLFAGETETVIQNFSLLIEKSKQIGLHIVSCFIMYNLSLLRALITENECNITYKENRRK